MSLDYTRLLEIHEKKSECFMAGTITIKAAAEFDSNVGEVNGELAVENYKLGNIPKDVIITGAYVYVQTLADGADPLASFGITEGGKELVEEADLTGVGGEAGKILVAGDYITTGSGDELWMNLDFASADNTVGTFIFVIEYMEYKLNTGNLTRITQRIA